MIIPCLFMKIQLFNVPKRKNKRPVNIDVNLYELLKTIPPTTVLFFMPHIEKLVYKPTKKIPKALKKNAPCDCESNEKKRIRQTLRERAMWELKVHYSPELLIYTSIQRPNYTKYYGRITNCIIALRRIQYTGRQNLVPKSWNIMFYLTNEYLSETEKGSKYEIYFTRRKPIS